MFISIVFVEKSTKLSEKEREELLSQIDFSRVNEETITACKSNKLIPQQLITDAALSLCAKLRGELEEAQGRLRLAESELAKSRPSYTSSSKIFSLHQSSNLIFHSIKVIEVVIMTLLVFILVLVQHTPLVMISH